MKEDINIFLDLDGTMVSYHDRFYELYKNAYKKIGVNPLSKEEFIKQRRTGDIQYPPEIYEDVMNFYRKNFETMKYLKYDKLIPGMYDVYCSLKERYPINIVTFRGNRKTLIKQLDGFGISGVNVINQGFCKDKPCEKANMIKNVINNPKGFIIGDTFYEILAGKKLGLTTIAVTYGDQNRKTLEKYNPDFIVDGAEEILSIVL